MINAEMCRGLKMPRAESLFVVYCILKYFFGRKLFFELIFKGGGLIERNQERKNKEYAHIICVTASNAMLKKTKIYMT